jgi:hypothetical protein
MNTPNFFANTSNVATNPVLTAAAPTPPVIRAACPYSAILSFAGSKIFVTVFLL